MKLTDTQEVIDNKFTNSLIKAAIGLVLVGSIGMICVDKLACMINKHYFERKFKW